MGTAEFEAAFGHVSGDLYRRYREYSAQNLAGTLPPGDPMQLLEPPPLPCQPRDMNYDTTWCHGGALAGERGSGSRQRVAVSADDREASTSAG